MFKYALVSAVLVAGSLAASIALADPTATSGGSSSAQPPVPASSDTPPDDSNTVVCRWFETGSRFEEKVCRTKAEWDRITLDARRQLEHDAAKQAGIQGVGH